MNTTKVRTDKKYKYVSFSPSTNRYQFRVNNNEVGGDISKAFSVSRFGSKRAALTAALDYRENVLGSVD